MSDDMISKATEVLREKFAGGLDGAVKFSIDGVGDLRVDGGQTPPSVEQSSADADVTISASPDIFQELLAGDLDPTSAYMSGKIKIDGDMSMAMKLASLLS